MNLMNRLKWWIFFGVVSSCWPVFAQSIEITGWIRAEDTEAPLPGVEIVLEGVERLVYSNPNGFYRLAGIAPGTYGIRVFHPAYQVWGDTLELGEADLTLNIRLIPQAYDLAEVLIEEGGMPTFGRSRLRAVEGVAIYAAKKNEVVVLKDLTINLATNNSRQAYGRVAGLNIWESDGAGIQLGLGGRGLSPNRNANFNTRQNGYDISADALGYPESYYTPPLEAIDRIEIVRGAASLQYGTQFGGMLNFKFKEGPRDKKFSLTTRQTLGSYGLYTSFNSLGGSIGKTRYYGFYQYKTSKGWRPYSALDQHTAYGRVRHSFSEKLSLEGEYTFMHYLARQPGGLTDAQFREDPRQANRARNWFQVDWNLVALTLDYQLASATRLNSRTFGLAGGRDALGNLERINQIDFGGNRNFLSDDFRNWGNETRLIHRYQLFDQPSTLLVGTRYYQGLTLRRQGEGSDGTGPDFYYLNPERLEGSDFELPSRNFAWFAEHVFNLNDSWSITPGLRFEYIRTEAEGYYTNKVEDLAGNVLLNEQIYEEKENVRWFVFGGVGVSYRFKSSLELYGNFSQNYRAINFNDIRVNVGSLVVDPNLKDERGYNADVGLRGKVGKVLDIDLSSFFLAYRDRIGSVLKREPNPQFNNLVDRTFRFRTNVANARILGIESFAELNILEWLNLRIPHTRMAVFTNLALIQATYVDARESGIEGNEVELVPGVNFKTGFSYRWKTLGMSLQYAYVGEQFSDATNAIQTPTAIEGIIPAYQVMDFSLSYSMGRFKFESGVNNLTDERYFTRRATGYPGPGIIPAEARSFYLTLEFSL